MSDTYDDSPIRILPPPPPWLEGNYEITIEPLSNDYTVVAVHVQRAQRSATAILGVAECSDRYFTFGPRATVIMLAPPVVELGAESVSGIAQAWVADADALDRAVKMAIRECEGRNEGKVRA